MNRKVAIIVLWTAALLAPPSLHAVNEAPAPMAAGPDETEINPHSDLIFRATGATSCADCHQIGRDGRMRQRPLDNALVLELKGKAKGVHGPGRFGDCLRCHAGGDKGVEKYRAR